MSVCQIVKCDVVVGMSSNCGFLRTLRSTRRRPKSGYWRCTNQVECVQFEYRCICINTDFS
jgi:hypothetical protein